MAELSDKRYLAYSILEFLDREVMEKDATGDRREWLGIAMHNVSKAFDVTLANQEFHTSQPLDQIYQDYLGRTRNTGNQSSGGPEVNRIIDIGNMYILPMETNDENKRKAETNKNSGNDEMTDGQYWEALESYTNAINLDGRNAIYFCNRAASYLKLNNLPKALRDCQVAIQLNPGYARAYGRMGVTYSAMTDHARAYDCYRKAAELEPGNDTYTNNVQATQEILALESANAGTSAGTGAGTGGGARAGTGGEARAGTGGGTRAGTAARAGGEARAGTGGGTRGGTGGGARAGTGARAGAGTGAGHAGNTNPGFGPFAGIDPFFNDVQAFFNRPEVQNLESRFQQLTEEWGRLAEEFMPNFGNPNPPQGNGNNS